MDPRRWLDLRAHRPFQKPVLVHRPVDAWRSTLPAAPGTSGWTQTFLRTPRFRAGSLARIGDQDLLVLVENETIK